MISSDIINDILLIAIEEYLNNPQLRLGQCIFSIAHVMFPEITNKLRGTHHDCFHDSFKINSFVSALKSC